MLSVLVIGVTASPFIQTVHEPLGHPEHATTEVCVIIVTHVLPLPKDSVTPSITSEAFGYSCHHCVYFFLSRELPHYIGRCHRLIIKHIGSNQPVQVTSCITFSKLIDLFELCFSHMYKERTIAACEILENYLVFVPGPWHRAPKPL